MKIKNLEKEIEIKLKSCLTEFSNLLTLYEAYNEKASEKGKKKFLVKLDKKYGKTIDNLQDRADIL